MTKVNPREVQQIIDLVDASYVESISDSQCHSVYARPDTIEEVSRLVAWADRMKCPVVPVGSGSQIRAAYPAARPGLNGLVGAIRSRFDVDRQPPQLLLIGLDRLNQVVEHSPADLVASVQCGAPWAVAQSRLKEHGQWIPVDPAHESSSTVGGILAMNRFGPRRLRYGTLRDWVIGTTLVRPDGAIVRAGGMVVKNVSGYDLAKLYIGSRGCFGILVQANFKLSPVPMSRAFLRIRVSEADDARVWASFREFWDGDWPLASAILLRRWNAPGALSRPDGLVKFELEGTPVALRARRDRALDLAHRAGWSDVEWSDDPAAYHDTGADGPIIRLHYPPASHGELMERIRSLPSSDHPHWERSLLGSGVSWLSWQQELSADGMDRLGSIVNAIGGFAIVERSPLTQRMSTNREEQMEAREAREDDATSQPRRDLEARIVRALNPHGTILPGIPLPSGPSV